MYLRFINNSNYITTEKRQIAHLHNGPDLLTVKNLSDVSFQILWVILINLGQKHQYWDTCAAEIELNEPILLRFADCRLHSNMQMSYTSQTSLCQWPGSS